MSRNYKFHNSIIPKVYRLLFCVACKTPLPERGGRLQVASHQAPDSASVTVQLT